MPFPLPTPAELTRRLETEMEQALLAVRPDASPAAVARSVRSPRGVVAALIRVTAMALYENHLHLRYWGAQYLPDTAERAQLERHASIWGIVRRPATRAIGLAAVEGDEGTIVPEGAILIGANATYEVTTAAELGAEGAVLDIRAVLAGPDGNADAGTPLSFETPIAGLAAPIAVVDEDGLVGGSDIEGDASLLARLLQTIREPAHGGAFFDYPAWVQNHFAAVEVKTLPNWVGLGTVGVAVAMGTALDPREPTEPEIEAIAAYLETVRPVTAEVIVLGAELVSQDFTIAIDPFNVGVKNAVTAAITAFFAAEARIGQRIPRSRLSEAISAAAGEYRHEVLDPAGDIVPEASELIVPGSITWETFDDA